MKRTQKESLVREDMCQLHNTKQSHPTYASDGVLRRQCAGGQCAQSSVLRDILCHKEPVLPESTFPVGPAGWVS